MAAARFGGTMPGAQGLLESGRVDVADHILDEVAAPHVSLAIDAEYAFARATGAAAAGMPDIVDGKQRIELCEQRNFVVGVIVRVRLSALTQT